MDTYMDLNFNIYEGDEIWRRQRSREDSAAYEWVDTAGNRTRAEEDWHRRFADTEIFQDVIAAVG
jgi:hypothetical protein